MMMTITGSTDGLRGAAGTFGDVGPFDESELEELVARIGAVSHAKGEPLARLGEQIGDIGLVVSGSVELIRHRYDHRRVILQVLHRGDVYGDVPFLCERPLAFEIRALADTQVVHLPTDVLRQLLATRPHVCQRFMYSLAVRLESMQRRILQLTAGDITHRVATLLLDESGGAPGEVVITQTALAELLDATRQSVNETLRNLEAQGGLRLAYGRVVVVDPARLADLIEDR